MKLLALLLLFSSDSVHALHGSTTSLNKETGALKESSCVYRKNSLEGFTVCGGSLLFSSPLLNPLPGSIKSKGFHVRSIREGNKSAWIGSFSNAVVILTQEDLLTCNPSGKLLNEGVCSAAMSLQRGNDPLKFLCIHSNKISQ